MATLAEILTALKNWGTDWKSVALAERGLKEQAITGLQSAEAALGDKTRELQAFLDNDAATDADQIIKAQADQAETDRAAAEAVLNEVIAADQSTDDPEVDPPADEPTDPAPGDDVPVETPPTDEASTPQ